jgi:hypothetical protein
MRSKLDEILARPSAASVFEDLIVGVGTVAAALAIGQLLELPDRVHEIAADDAGAFVVATLLLVIALLLGGLASALHCVRRLSREHAAGAASPRPARPGVVDGGLPHIADDEIGLVPRAPWQETPRRRVPNVTSEC